MKRLILLMLAVMSALSSGAALAQTGEDMAIRFYILPIERVDYARGPKYFAWRFDPDPPGLPDAWNMLDYGLIDMCILASNISATDHASLAAHADVFAIPVNIDVTMTAQERGALAAYLEAHGVPGDWIAAQDTWRTALRTVSGMFLYMQRLTAVSGQSPRDWGYSLNTQWRDMTEPVQNYIIEAATGSGYDTSFIRATTQLRAILKSLSDQWGNKTIYLGMTTL